MMNDIIARINELYHKSQDVGLTPEEKEEQSRLRGEYLASIRRNVKSQLENIDLVNPDGTITNVGEEHAKKGTVKRTM